MTLRIHAQIIPFGDETKAYDIGVFNISNIGMSGDGVLTEYIVEVDTYRTKNNGKPIIVHHNRYDGFERLVEIAMNAVIDHKDT